MKKLIGYIISALGLIILFAGIIKEINQFLMGFIEGLLSLKKNQLIISEIYFIIIGAIILAVGIYMLSKHSSKSSKKIQEVPIYHGDKIVGYRRHTN